MHFPWHSPPLSPRARLNCGLCRTNIALTGGSKRVAACPVDGDERPHSRSADGLTLPHLGSIATGVGTHYPPLVGLPAVRLGSLLPSLGKATGLLITSLLPPLGRAADVRLESLLPKLGRATGLPTKLLLTAWNGMGQHDTHHITA